MMNILRPIFSINGVKYKLENPKIFDEEFFRVNVYDYINYQNTIRQWTHSIYLNIMIDFFTLVYDLKLWLRLNKKYV